MNLSLIKKLCVVKKIELYNVLFKYLKKYGYKNIVAKPKYIIAEGDLPICLIAHMDTVFSYEPYMDDFFYDAHKKVLWNPGGSGFDDRAGIYIILNLLNEGFRPHIIFTDEEEMGGIGAYELIGDFSECPFEDCRALVQLDRANRNDCVFYFCDNKDFEKYISSFGFKFDIGTFTDISIIAPAWKIAAVNLSVGYEDEHTSCERLHCNWCDETLNKVRRMLTLSPNMKKYIYISKQHTYSKLRPWNCSPKEDDYEFLNEIFDYGNTCLICGKDLSKEEHTTVVDNEYNYRVCDDCWNKYYSDIN